MKYKYSFHTKDVAYTITLTSNADINFFELKNKEIPLTIIDRETGSQVWINLQEIVYMEKEVKNDSGSKED